MKIDVGSAISAHHAQATARKRLEVGGRGGGDVLLVGGLIGVLGHREEVEDEGELFEERMNRLVAELTEQFTESAKLEKAIKANLKGLNF